MLNYNFYYMKDTLRKAVFLLLFMGACLPLAFGQHYPDIPAQVPFGGINVKFDQSARNIIASDVKVLMINQKYWEEKLERALLYFPIIESIFIDQEIPMDFKYLAAQESSLIPDAVSSSNAVGFWQFKEDTALELGLRVDRHVDERKNISASTRAAAQYLKRSNGHFNNWVSSLYSYYQGVNGAREKIGDNWNNAYEITITGKTDRYVLRFFAYKIAFEAGLDSYQSKNPITLVEANAGKGRSLEEIAAELKVSSSDLKNYNIWLRGNKVPSDKSYFVTVPVASSKVGNVKESLAIVQSDNTLASKYEYDDIGFPKLKKSGNQPSGYNSHVSYEINGLRGILAKAGDYPNSLAKAGGISASKFRKYNDMDVSMSVVPGEVYYLERKNKKATVEYHTVRPGETLQSISHMYGIRMKELLKYNRILSKGYYLETGRELWLTKRRPSHVRVKINEVPKVQEEKMPVQVAKEVVAENKPAENQQPEAAATSVAAEASTRKTENTIPKDASERRRYTPKLADKKEEPKTTAPQPEPKTAPEPKEAEVAAQTGTAEEKVVSRPNNRIVIVTEDERPKPYVSRRAGSKPASSDDVKPVYSPAPSAGARKPPVQETQTAAPKTEIAATTPENTASGEPEYYTVLKGDTYYSISRKYGTTVTDLLELNGLKISNNLQVGKKLLVREAAAAPREEKATVITTATEREKPAAKPAPQNVTHTVRKGETLFSISKRYGVSVQELTKHNSLRGSGLQAGQKLRIPQK